MSSPLAAAESNVPFSLERLRELTNVPAELYAALGEAVASLESARAVVGDLRRLTGLDPTGRGRDAPRKLSASVHSPSGATRRRILLVDDEPLLRSSLRRLLGRDHEMVVCADGGDALDELRSGRHVDVIICDVTMPGMNGKELYEAVERVLPAIAPRFLFLTGGAYAPELAAFCARMHDRIMTKPPALAELRRAVLRDPLQPQE